jgi:hypothetical protein
MNIEQSKFFSYIGARKLTKLKYCSNSYDLTCRKRIVQKVFIKSHNSIFWKHLLLGDVRMQRCNLPRFYADTTVTHSRIKYEL